MEKKDKPLFSRRAFFSISGAMAAAAAAGCRTVRPGIVETAARVKDKKTHPVVVIGAGIGGLTSAAYFAKAGFPVTVVEQHGIPGGYATSFERSGGRYRFEVSLHMSSVEGSATSAILHELGIFDEIEVVELPELCRIIAPDHDITLPEASPEGCIRALSRHFPEEETGIRSFVNEMIGVADNVRRMGDGMSLLDKLLFPFRYPFLRRMYNMTLADRLSKHLHKPELKSLLSAFWDFYGLPPSKLSGFYYAVGTGQFIKGGAYCYKPRSQALSDALANVIERHGGRVLYHREVDQIVLREGTVAGARLKGGEILPARAVISGASGPVTFERLLPPDAIPRSYRAKVGSFGPSMSSFVVWLGLDQDITDRIREYEIFLLQSYDHEAAYRAQTRCDPSQADMAVTVFDNAFPGYSAPGRSTVGLMFICGFEPWRRFAADYSAGRKIAYNAEKRRVAQVLVERAESAVMPGLSGMIDIMVTATPLTNLRFTKNPGGAIYGYDQCLANSFNRRLNNRTPVRGLYLAGSWSFPGGGFTACQSSGRRAFEQFVTDWG